MARDLLAATPKIADFGLAKPTPSGGPTTGRLTRRIMGTPAYLAPEQAAAIAGGRPGGGRLLAGRDPLRTADRPPALPGATAMETLVQAAHQEPVPRAGCVQRCAARPRHHLPEVPGQGPRQRYATAGELADDLERFLEHRPILARPIGPGGTPARWVGLHVGLTAALSGAALSLVLLVVGSLLSAAHFREMEHEQRELSRAKERLAEENEIERGKAVRAQAREAGLRERAEEEGREGRGETVLRPHEPGGAGGHVPQRDRAGRPVAGPLGRGPARTYRLGVVLPKGLCHRDLRTLRRPRGPARWPGVRTAGWLAEADGRRGSAPRSGLRSLAAAEVSSLASSPDGAARRLDGR